MRARRPSPRPGGARLSVGFISLGCAKNLVDSEVLADGLRRAGFVLAPSPERADVVVVNTCAFIRDAQRESVEAILEACSWKAAGRCRAVLVAGCLPQRYRREVAGLFPEVDAFLGLDALDRAGAAVRRALAGGPVADIPARSSRVPNPPPGRLLFTGAPYAYLKIAEGCNHGCTFCAIPAIRGRTRSRPIAGIVAEAEALLGRGVRELNLIAQDVTAYGVDRGPSVNLPALLRALGRIGGRFWIRLLYGHPALVTPALLDAMGEVGQVCHYLDLPIQHCEGGLLRAMGRPGNEAALRATFRLIRAVLPDAVLRTTCLVGFPGETERPFRKLLDFLDEIRFDHLAVFAFSPEEGTPAAGLPGRVQAAEARRRRRRLLLAQQARVRKRAEERIGEREALLVERYDRRRGAGLARSYGRAPSVDGWVLLRAPASACAPGRWVAGRYTAASGYDLWAVREST